MDGRKVSLGSVATLIMGQSPAGESYNHDGDGLPLLNGPTDFGPVHPRCTMFTTGSERECEPGDLIFCVRGSTTGRMNWADQVYSLGRGVSAIRGESETETRYIRYALEASLDSLLRFAAGGTFPNLTKDSILKFEIPYTENRDRTVAVLSACDDVIGATHSFISLYQSLKKTVMERLLTRGIGHTRFKKTEIGEIPESWDVVKLGDSSVAEIVGGTTPSRSVPDYWGGDIPWVTPTDITALEFPEIGRTKEAVTDRGLRESSLNLLPPGSVLMTSRATIGYCAINKVPMTTNQGLASFLCKRNVHNIYLLYLLQHMKPVLERLASGSTFKEISKNSLRSLTIPLPPLDEQRRIAVALQRIDEYVVIEREYQRTQNKLKKGLMQVLLTGKVRVKV